MLNISVVIPVGPAESDLGPMLNRLTYLRQAKEIVFVFCPGSEGLKSQLDPYLCDRVRYLVSEQGRAVQLNLGADSCSGEFIWFLHLDSQVANNHWQMLNQSLQRWPERLHYFNLKFEADGRGPMWLNSLGANLRSKYLGLPFGDQGFCISRNKFDLLGGYPIDAAYGEDHLFVWRAHQKRVRLANTGSTLTTSARKYSAVGWGRLTFKYQLYWIKQALPQFWLLLKGKFSI
ncbi:glycosyltransferase [Amphritea balenae]|uniref:Glycosyltransferase n=1 Tax=Amphritea balenae TaxID=452629 RepID=A0A3P1SHH0_9GAMM|nr:glycosyltransferase [Amphritea balenae]RRC96733.1 glycosyltransferase [Amphritea balenae]